MASVKSLLVAIIVATITSVEGHSLDTYTKIVYKSCGCEKFYTNPTRQAIMDKTGISLLQKCAANFFQHTLQLAKDEEKGQYMLVGSSQEGMTTNRWFRFNIPIGSRRMFKSREVTFTRLSHQKMKEVQTLGGKSCITVEYSFTFETLKVQINAEPEGYNAVCFYQAKSINEESVSGKQ